MRVHEAKDFLAQQTAEQAAIENVLLSDLEKRMMYFTESGECPEDPIALNGAFEAEYNTEEYEAKISNLLHHAYKRIRKESQETGRFWDGAIRVLRKGDHYLMVLWDIGPIERPPHDSLKLLGTAILVIIVGSILILGATFLSDHYNIHWRSSPKTQTSVPVWIQRFLIFIMVGGYVYYVVLPWLLKKPPVGIGQILVRLFGAVFKNRNEK
jgi:hypothetical protein